MAKSHVELLPIVPSEERRRHCHRDRLACCRNQLHEGLRLGPRGVDLTLGKGALEIDGVHLAQTGRERVEVLEVNLVAFISLTLKVLAEHVGVQEEAFCLGRECLDCCVQGRRAQAANDESLELPGINLGVLAEGRQLLADLLVMYVRLLLCLEHVYVVELDLAHVPRAI